MRKIYVVVLTAFILLLFSDNTFSGFKKERIAVIDFKQDKISGKRNFNETLSNSLIMKMAETRRFDPIERRLLLKIFQEMRLDLKKFREDDAVKLGKILGAKIIIIGEITSSGHNFAVTANLIETESGSTFAVLQAKSSSAVELASKLAIEIERVIPLEGMIVENSDGKVVIDLGELHGVKNGMKFTVSKIDKTIRHPRSEEILGFEELEIGIIEISKVQKKYSTGTIISKSSVQAILPENIARSIVDEEISKGKSLREIAKRKWGKTKSWAVVIGIDNYSKEKGWSSLPYSVNDAKTLKEDLIKYLGFSNDRIIQIYNNDATKSRIERLLGDELPNEVKEDDRVLIFFSGHGDTRKTRNGDLGYLVPVDGDHKSPHSTYVSMAQIKDFSDLIPAKQLIFIIDACYSGIAGVHFKGKVEEETKEQVEIFINGGGRQLLTAGTAQEKVAMSKKWDNHSVYTYYLLRGLKGEADYNKDSVISTRELQVFLEDIVPKEANQHPQMFQLSEGQFIFYREGEL